MTTLRTQPRRRFARGTAAVTSLIIAAGAALAAPLPASAASSATVPQSYAEGRFLSGSLLGTDLSKILDLASAQAFNDGTQGTKLARDPLQLTVLSALTIGNGKSVQLSLGDVIQLGALNQYARAAQGGTSLAASGAVAHDGAIGIGADSSAPTGITTLDLDGLLGSEFTNAIADLRLALSAVAARADGKGAQVSGQYHVAGMTLHLTTPAIAKLTEKVDKALKVVSDEISALTSKDGKLLSAVSNVVDDLDPALSLIGTKAEVSASIEASALRDLVHKALTAKYSDRGLTFNLETGEIRVDLAKYAGHLNGRSVGSELLTDEVVERLLDEILETVSGLADVVVETVRGALRDLKVDVSAKVRVDVAQAPIVKEVCTTVEKVIQVPKEVTSGGSKGGLVGGILDGLGNLVDKLVDKPLEYVDKIVKELVCHEESIAVAPLKTSLDLNLSATVDELVSGANVNVSATAKVLGIPVKVNTGLVVSELGKVLNSTLLGSKGVVGKLTTALDERLVDPALAGLLGSDSSVQKLLTKVLSIKLNVQERSTSEGGHTGKFFTQTAVRVAVLGGSAATLDIASATVGPDTTAVVDDPENPDPEDPIDDPETPGNPNDPEGPGNGVPGGPTDLPFTGVSIAGIVLLVAALLGTGGWLLVRSRMRASAALTDLEV